MDRQELKVTFYRVTQYQQVCQLVRRSANAAFFHGLLFAVVAFLISESVGLRHPIVLVFAGLAAIEFAIGFWKKLSPSVESFFVDGLNSLAFGGFLVGRYALVKLGVVKMHADIITLILGLWVLYGAWTQFKAYWHLRRAFRERPSREQLAYVGEMVREIRESDPEEAADSLVLPSDPPIRALLADEVFFLLDEGAGGAVVLDRSDLTLRREAPVGGHPALGFLTLHSHDFPAFPLSDANWRNYCRWKGEPAGF